MKTNVFLPALLLFFLPFCLWAQVGEMPKNPEERTQVKIEPDLKKALKSKDLAAYADLIRQTTGHFFGDTKDYKTALNFLEDLENPTDSLAFWQFKILIAGGYGTKAKLKDAKELFEKANFKQWVLSYPHKNDLPFAQFFEVYEASQKQDASAQILLARYFLEYQISYPIGLALLEKNSAADAQYLAKKWQLAKNANQTDPNLFVMPLADLQKYVELGSVLAKMAYGNYATRHQENTPRAKPFLLEVQTDSMLAPKALALRCGLSNDKDKILAIKQFHETHETTIWGKRFAHAITEWKSIEKELQSFEGFLRLNQNYGLGFSPANLTSLEGLAEGFAWLQTPANQYLSPYLSAYQKKLNEYFFQNLNGISDLENVLIALKKLEETQILNLVGDWKTKDSLLLVEKASKWITQETKLDGLLKYASIFDRQQIPYWTVFGKTIEKHFAQQTDPYLFFTLKYDKTTSNFVQKVIPNLDSLSQTHFVRLATNAIDSLFYETKAQIQYKNFQNFEEVKEINDFLEKSKMDLWQKDSLKRFSIRTAIQHFYGETPTDLQVLDLRKNISLQGDWFKDTAQEMFFVFTSHNPNWFKGHHVAEDKEYFYEVVFSTEQQYYLVNIKRKGENGYEVIYEHHWKKGSETDPLSPLQLTITYFLKEDAMRRPLQNDFLLIKTYPDLRTETTVKGRMKEIVKIKESFNPPKYDYQALIRYTVEYLISNEPAFLKD